MAVRQITKKCPYCGRIYEQRTCGGLGRNASIEDAWTFGSPMKICAYCKKIFIDKDVKELAITQPRKADLAKVTASTRSLLIAGALVTLLLYLLGQRSFALVAAGIAVLYLVLDLGMYPMRMGKLKKERAASEQRLSDPEYARALKRSGIDVPERYLNDATVTNATNGKDEEK